MGSILLLGFSRLPSLSFVSGREREKENGCQHMLLDVLITLHKQLRSTTLFGNEQCRWSALSIHFHYVLASIKSLSLSFSVSLSLWRWCHLMVRIVYEFLWPLWRIIVIRRALLVLSSTAPAHPYLRCAHFRVGFSCVCVAEANRCHFLFDQIMRQTHCVSVCGHPHHHLSAAKAFWNSCRAHVYA